MSGAGGHQVFRRRCFQARTASVRRTCMQVRRCTTWPLWRLCGTSVPPLYFRSCVFAPLYFWHRR